jgi:ABC-2 type transport system permease protein
MTNAAIEISARSPSALGRQLGGLYAIWLREIKRAIRDRGQLIGGISRPLLWVVIMGIGLNPYFRGEIYGEVRFVVPYTYLQFIFPAVILLMYTSVLWGGGESATQARSRAWVYSPARTAARGKPGGNRRRAQA